MNHRSFLRNLERSTRYQDMLRDSYVQRHDVPHEDDSWDTADSEDDGGYHTFYMDEAEEVPMQEPLSEDDQYLERMGIAL